MWRHVQMWLIVANAATHCKTKRKHTHTHTSLDYNAHRTLMVVVVVGVEWTQCVWNRANASNGAA